MTDLFAARADMAISLGFHIIFAEIGIAMPVLMVLAEWRAHRTGDARYRELAKRWAKGVAVLFAVGAVSGTILSFELGLLWPGFMKYAGAIIGIPFSLEGIAFFAEAIFLGVYLYAWERIAPWAHIAAGCVVAISGAASAVFVVMVNAWMNVPAGVVTHGTDIVRIDLLAGMRSPAALAQVIHMLLAAYAATGLAVAGIHAFRILRGSTSDLHPRALMLALGVAAPAAILLPLSGDLNGRMVAATQPVKLAAMEGQFATERGAPLRIGGWPDETARVTRLALEIPAGLSLMAYHDPHAEVKGLNDFPREDWPPVVPVHVGFQVMTLLGGAMALLSLWSLTVMLRGKDLTTRKGLLRATMIVAPFGFIATEAGWTVTEVGRQPWIVQGLLRTSEAVTPMPGLSFPLAVFTLLYVGLGVLVVVALASLVRSVDSA